MHINTWKNWRALIGVVLHVYNRDFRMVSVTKSVFNLKSVWILTSLLDFFCWLGLGLGSVTPRQCWAEAASVFPCARSPEPAQCAGAQQLWHHLCWGREWDRRLLRPCLWARPLWQQTGRLARGKMVMGTLLGAFHSYYWLQMCCIDESSIFVASFSFLKVMFIYSDSNWAIHVTKLIQCGTSLLYLVTYSLGLWVKNLYFCFVSSCKAVELAFLIPSS